MNNDTSVIYWKAIDQKAIITNLLDIVKTDNENINKLLIKLYQKNNEILALC